MLNFIFGLKNHIVIIFRNERRIKMKFKEIEIGKSEQIRALLTGIEERGAKAGTRYLVLNFTDGEQTVTANYWNCTRDEFTAKEGQVLDLRVDAKLYKGSTSYTVQSYLLTDESPEAYVTSAPMDPVDMFNKIHSFAANLGVYGMHPVRGKPRETSYMGGWEICPSQHPRRAFVSHLYYVTVCIPVVQGV